MAPSLTCEASANTLKTVPFVWSMKRLCDQSGDAPKFISIGGKDIPFNTNFRLIFSSSVESPVLPSFLFSVSFFACLRVPCDNNK